MESAVAPLPLESTITTHRLLSLFSLHCSSTLWLVALILLFFLFLHIALEFFNLRCKLSIVGFLSCEQGSSFFQVVVGLVELFLF